MAYTIYEGKLTKTGRSPAATIYANGGIALNATASRLFRKNGIESVILLSDAAARKIALRSTTRDDKRSYVVSYGRNFTGAHVSAKGFLMEIGWDRKKYRIDARWDGENLLLELMTPEWGKGDKRKLLPLEIKKEKAG